MGDSRHRPGRIAPSILAADFARLAQQLAEIEHSGQADRVHVDVMDGTFVPPISFGGPVVAAIHRSTTLPLDIHLMVERPYRLLEEYAALGAGWISVHIEACSHIHRDIQGIRRLGMSPGVAINPGTSLSVLDAIAEDVDIILVMTVDPGWGGQPFIPSSLARISTLRRWLDDRGLNHVAIEVDGGVNAQNIAAARNAGAEIFVVGSGIFGHTNGIAAAMDEISVQLRDD